MEGKSTADTELLQRMQRDINCLLDQDRTTRRNALMALNQKCSSPDTIKGKFGFPICFGRLLSNQLDD